MNKNIENLIEYQEIDAKLIALEESEKNSTALEQAKRAKRHYEKAVNIANSCEEKADEYFGTFGKLQDDYNFAKSNIEKLKANLERATVDDDIDRYKDDLNAVKAKLDFILGEIDELVKRIKEIDENSTIAKQKKKSWKEEYDKFASDYNQLKSDNKTQREQLNCELETKAKEIGDHTLVEKYNALRKSGKLPATAILEREKDTARCGYCKTALNLNSAAEIRLKEYGFCPTCEHILYV